MTTLAAQRTRSVPVAWIAVGVVLAALVAASCALFVQNRDLSSRVSHLQSSTGTQAQLAVQAKQIHSLRGELATATTANQALTARVAAMFNLANPKSFAAQLHVVYNCIPQLEAQVNSLNLAGVGSGLPYIQDNAQVSADCSTLIYGPVNP